MRTAVRFSVLPVTRKQGGHDREGHCPAEKYLEAPTQDDQKTTRRIRQVPNGTGGRSAMTGDALWLVVIAILLWIVRDHYKKCGGTKGTKAPMADEESDVFKDEVEQTDDAHQ
jgi:hypothetical protein